MAKRKRAKRKINPIPITAAKTKRGVKVSVTVGSMAAAKKIAKRMGARVGNPSTVEKPFVRQCSNCGYEERFKSRPKRKACPRCGRMMSVRNWAKK